MKHSLQLKLSQHLTLTPQLQQSIRLLQLSTLELNQELEQILQDNPLLERLEPGMDASFPEKGNESDNAREGVEAQEGGLEQTRQNDAETEPAFDQWDEYGSGYASHPDDDEEREFQQADGSQASLRQHLLGQLALSQFSERDRKLVMLLIDSLDERGYLSHPIEELAAVLPEELEIDVDELMTALRYLQSFDPAGVGARDLAECLALQLRTLPDETPTRNLALTIVTKHLDWLAARDYNRLKKVPGATDATLRQARDLITSLNPAPGARFAAEDARYVVPDVILKKVKGLWTVTLNAEAMPKLRVNQLYSSILRTNRDASHSQLMSQLQEARWLIKNVQQRFDTILRVSQAIVDRQRHFFEYGEVAMRPLVLREIAEVVGLHESTISRVTTQKFMLTPRGIYELKYFFGSHVATETGGTASSTAIRALIRQLIDAENPKSPLPDGEIATLLGQQGIVVARRTIAKYRESMNIPPVNMRKTL
jgi:RNA polymerase sigma-54 factor